MEKSKSKRKGRGNRKEQSKVIVTEVRKYIARGDASFNGAKVSKNIRHLTTWKWQKRHRKINKIGENTVPRTRQVKRSEHTSLYKSKRQCT